MSMVGRGAPVRRRRVVLLAGMLALTGALGGSSGALALPKNEPAQVDPPGGNQNGCVPEAGPYFAASVSPLRGLTAPDTVVGVGQHVTLQGRAYMERVTVTCSYSATPMANPRWSLSFLPMGGDPVAANGQLSTTAGFRSGFDPQALGTYTATFQADPPTGVTLQPVVIRVDVVDSPIGWSSLGPDGTRNLATGRINALAQAPDGTMYAGAPTGGVWKSTDGTASWRPMSDRKAAALGSISSLAVLPNGTVLAGTGDSVNGLGTGAGVYTSADGGVTWAADPLLCPSGQVRSSGVVYRLVVGPGTSPLVWMAGTQGVLRRAPGGCWVRIGGAGWGTVTDLQRDPTDASGATLVAGVPGLGVMRTTNAVTGAPAAWTDAMGGDRLTGGSQNIAVAVGANGNLYAAFGFGQGATDRMQIWRLPAGQTTAMQSNTATFVDQLGRPQGAMTCWGNACTYNLRLAVDPADGNDVWFGTVPTWRSRNGAQTWTDVSNAERNGRRATHGDVHDFLFSGTWIYQADDGGVARSSLTGGPSDATSGGITWFARSRELNVAMFYQLGAASSRAGAIAGGLQDNGSQERVWGRAWGSLPGGGGDGWSAVYDAADAVASCAVSCSRSLMYYHRGWFNNLNITSSRITTGGTNIATARPIWGDPYRPGVLLASIGGQLYISYGNDGTQAATWACIDPTPGITTDAVQTVVASRSALPPAAGTYAVAVNDSASAKVFLVTLSAQPAGSATPSCATPAPATRTEIFPAGFVGPLVTWVQGLSEDPSQPCRFHLATTTIQAEWRATLLSNTENVCGQPFDATPLAGLSIDSSPLPAGLAARSIIADPAQAGTIYLGTDAGLYIGVPNGAVTDWRRARDFPTTRVDTLDVQQTTSGVPRFLYASTFGRGVWQRFLTGVTPPATQAGVLRASAGRGGTSGPRAAAHVSVTSCRAWMVSDDPAGPGERAWVDLHVRNTDPPFPIDVRATPTRHGDLQPYFGRERVQVPTGDSWIRLMVSYDADAAPLRLQTDGLAVEFLAAGNEPIGRTDCDFQVTWRRHDAAILNVETILHQREAGVATEHAVVKVDRAGHLPLERTTPFQLAVPVDETVKLSVVDPLDEGEFRGWLVDGAPRVGDTVQVHVTRDRTVTLAYAEP